MAEMRVFFKDKEEVCPYNTAHMIRLTKTQSHLVKCVKAFPNAEKVACPFDTTHRIHPTEMSDHMSTCKAQYIVTHFKYTVGESGYDPENYLPVLNIDLQCEENWDEDPPAPTYDPFHKLSDGKLLVQLKGATPSERKAYRKIREELFSSAASNENGTMKHNNMETSVQENGKDDGASGSKSGEGSVMSLSSSIYSHSEHDSSSQDESIADVQQQIDNSEPFSFPMYAEIARNTKLESPKYEGDVSVKVSKKHFSKDYNVDKPLIITFQPPTLSDVHMNIPHQPYTLYSTPPFTYSQSTLNNTKRNEQGIQSKSDSISFGRFANRGRRAI